MTKLSKDKEEKLKQYIEGNADESSAEMIRDLLAEGEGDSVLRNILEKDWRNFDKQESSQVNMLHTLDRIHHIIRRNEIKRERKPVQRFLKFYMRIAAILFIPVIAAGLIYMFLFKTSLSTDQLVSCTIHSPMGSRIAFNLPDGTSGMLNSGSRLSYSLPFTDNRHITLVGEAWLNVKRDEAHPFEINTGNSTVKVLGTSLNVNAYPDENYVEVVLEKGSVEFLNNLDNNSVRMIPDDRLIFKDGNIRKSVTDPVKYSAWTEGKLVFRSDPMEEVARRIERWYNARIILADPELKKYSFRATFEDDKIEEVLMFLSMTSPIKYKISPRTLLPDGTYEKQIVTIYINQDKPRQ
ncbi:MAG TPA: FecR domain-containing protein [Bacteroidales bacterium]|nr:FecR domain-containing protein [Bacteroidales bacterium]